MNEVKQAIAGLINRLHMEQRQQLTEITKKLEQIERKLDALTPDKQPQD